MRRAARAKQPAPMLTEAERQIWVRRDVARREALAVTGMVFSGGRRV
jgi:hypothetical protein